MGLHRFVAVLTALMLVAALALRQDVRMRRRSHRPTAPCLWPRTALETTRPSSDAIVGAVDGDVVFIEPGEYVVGIVTEHVVDLPRG